MHNMHTRLIESGRITQVDSLASQTDREGKNRTRTAFRHFRWCRVGHDPFSHSGAPVTALSPRRRAGKVLGRQARVSVQAVVVRGSQRVVQVKEGEEEREQRSAAQWPPQPQ